MDFERLLVLTESVIDDQFYDIPVGKEQDVANLALQNAFDVKCEELDHDKGGRIPTNKTPQELLQLAAQSPDTIYRFIKRNYEHLPFFEFALRTSDHEQEYFLIIKLKNMFGRIIVDKFNLLPSS